MENVLLMNVLQLEQQLNNINPHCKLIATVQANSVGELTDAHKRLKQKNVSIIFHYDEGQYSFFYHLEKRPNIKINCKF